MTRLSRASKYGENCIEIASPSLQKRFIIKAETEPIADMFVRSFQKAKAAANSVNLRALNRLLAANNALNASKEQLKDLVAKNGM
jgi:hypothetical protein